MTSVPGRPVGCLNRDPSWLTFMLAVAATGVSEFLCVRRFQTKLLGC
jgi:hypothetical protein